MEQERVNVRRMAQHQVPVMLRLIGAVNHKISRIVRPLGVPEAQRTKNVSWRRGDSSGCIRVRSERRAVKNQLPYASTFKEVSMDAAEVGQLVTPVVEIALHVIDSTTSTQGK